MAKGTVYFMIAQVIFLSSGYAIHFGLGRYLGPAEYGTFGVILSLLAIVQLFLQSGVPKAVSKYVAEGYDIDTVKNEGLKVQTLFFLIIFVVYFSSAPFLAELLKDTSLTNYIRLSAFIIPIRAIHGVYTGTLNGIRAFDKQAKILALYSASRVPAVFALVIIGFAITGVIIGYLIAAVVALIFAKHWCVYEKDGESFSKGKLIKFAFPIILFAFAYTAIMNIDLLFVKALVMGEAKTGFYTSAWTIARLPFFVSVALFSTLLPSISKSTSINDNGKTKDYITNSLRYLLMILIPITLLISATSDNLLSLAYTPEYSQAGSALSILIFGITFLSVFVSLATIITASGKPKVSMGIALSLVPIAAVLNLMLVPEYQLEGAALATTITTVVGMIISGIYVAKRFGALMNPMSFCKICIASLIVCFIGIMFDVSGIILIGWYAVLILIYLGLLWVIGEIKNEDVEMVKSLF